MAWRRPQPPQMMFPARMIFPSSSSTSPAADAPDVHDSLRILHAEAFPTGVVRWQQVFRQVVESTLRRPLGQRGPCVPCSGSMCRKSCLKTVRASSAKAPASSTPVEKRHLPPQSSTTGHALGGIGLILRPFGFEQDVAADPQRIIHRLQPGRELFPFRMAEVNRAGSPAPAPR